VEPHVATAAALPEVLGGRKPAALVAMSTFRYLMPHNHRGGYFSEWAHMKEILAKAKVSADIGCILDAVDGADVLLSEVGCSDFAAEVAAVMLAHGYHIPAGGITRIPTAGLGHNFETPTLHGLFGTLLLLEAHTGNDSRPPGNTQDRWSRFWFVGAGHFV
jgi:hypothetical protein